MKPYLIYIFLGVLSGLLADPVNNLFLKRKNKVNLIKYIKIYLAKLTIIFLIVVIIYQIPTMKYYIDNITGGELTQTPTPPPVVSKSPTPKPKITPKKTSIYLSDLKNITVNDKPFFINPGESGNYIVSITGIEYSKAIQTILTSSNDFSEIEIKIPKGYTHLTGKIGFDDRDKDLGPDLTASFEVFQNNIFLKLYKVKNGYSELIDLPVQPETYIKFKAGCDGSFTEIHLNWAELKIN